MDDPLKRSTLGPTFEMKALLYRNKEFLATHALRSQAERQKKLAEEATKELLEMSRATAHKPTAEEELQYADVDSDKDSEEESDVSDKDDDDDDDSSNEEDEFGDL